MARPANGRMNSGLQRTTLQDILQRRGFDPDRVDLTALLDPTLGYAENREAVSEAVGLDLRPLDLVAYREEMEELRLRHAVEDAVALYLGRVEGGV